MKRILLIMTPFFQYYEDIKEELVRQNWEVVWFADEIELSASQRILRKVSNKPIEKKFDSYFSQNLDKVKGQTFDRILIIFGANFVKGKHISMLKAYFPKTKIVYYAWDSAENYPVIPELFKKSDEAYTFDYNDSLKYHVNFLPLFYLKKTQDIVEPKYDVSTVMSFYLEKTKSLSMVVNVLNNTKRNIFMYLKVLNKLYWNRLKIFHGRIFKTLSEEFFHLDAISKDKAYDIFSSSKAIIDCPLPNQNGLTMRTFEVLACNKKLITTNKNIANYDFYTSDNIFIVDENVHFIPNEFFESPFNINYEISDKYSIKSFIEVLVS